MVEFLESLGLSPQLLIFIISMVPFIELRGGIIVGLALELPWYEVFPICFAGNILPIPFVIMFGRKLLDWFGNTRLFGRFVTKYKRKLAEKSKKVKKYGPFGLALFVGIPVPGTGAWSGALLAVLLNLRLKLAVPAILAGLLLAGTIITLGTSGVLGAFSAIV